MKTKGKLLMLFIICFQGSKPFYGKGQRANASGSDCHMVSVTTAPLCNYSMGIATENVLNDWGRSSMQLQLMTAGSCSHCPRATVHQHLVLRTDSRTVLDAFLTVLEQCREDIQNASLKLAKFGILLENEWLLIHFLNICSTLPNLR